VAWKFDLLDNLFKKESTSQAQLGAIEGRIDELEKDDILMKFVNRNMWEQNVKVIVIHITDKKDVKASYYILRNKKGTTATIENTMDDRGKKNWIFMPSPKQTRDGLKILEAGELTVDSIASCIDLWITVKTKNVPSIFRIIRRSTWIDTFLPEW
jgi:hypothetical protein